MSVQDYKDFEDRLVELNNWQIEQQKKLKAFQEAQRLLLDLEHQNVLNTLNIQNASKNHESTEEDLSNKLPKKQEPKINPLPKPFKNNETKELFKMKCEPIKLVDAKTINFDFNPDSFSDDDKSQFDEEAKENCRVDPKRFLRRGEGLARFRMKMEDFKNPPKIYKEKRIKTYLNHKPVTNSRNVRSKPVKTTKPSKVNANQPSKNSKSVPVNIYTSKKCTTARNSNFKDSTTLQNYKKENYSQFPKVCSQKLSLKPCKISQECISVNKSKQDHTSNNDIDLLNENSHSKIHQDLDIERKKDEKELKIFEILEQKVVDSSFSSTSSFIDKLMDQSLNSPSKFSIEDEDKYKKSYTQGLKFLQSQFLNEEQIKKFENLNDFYLDEEEVVEEIDEENNQEDVLTPTNKEEVENNDIQEQDFEEDFEHLEELEKPPKELEIDKELTNHKTNKTLLHEYIKNFKKLKSMISENEHKIEEVKEDFSDIEEKKEPEHVVSQRQINLKMQRKGLQDNVKQILNWECATKRKPPKRVVKKNKIKTGKCEKPKILDKEENERIILDSTLLKNRLDELEKEISIFRIENKKLEKLQRECEEERIKLAREKKEFVKKFQEEQEQLEAKILEEQKKLQRDKAVFEKYCKHVKNQPNKAEREEITNLKKELEKIKETLTTKESRWAASQARIRNRIKALEKENSELKAENEKLSKMCVKKVKFDSGKNINTKIIHAINSELGRLKPTTVSSTHSANQSLSERSERNLGEKPIRRIKSAPNMKKTVENVGHCEVVVKEFDEKGLGSVSTDSGIETSGFRCEVSESRDFDKLDALLQGDYSKGSWNEGCEEIQTDNFCESPLFGQSNKKSKDSDSDLIESVVHEALFGNSQPKKTFSKDRELDKSGGKSNLTSSSKEKLDSILRLDSSNSLTSSKCTSESHKEREKNFYIDLEEEDEGDDNGSSKSFKDDYNHCHENGMMKSNEDEAKAKSHQGKESEITSWCRPKRDLNKDYLLDNSYCTRNYVIESTLEENGVREKIFDDGTREIRYPNGNIKKILPGSKIVKMIYYNGDVKEMNIPEGSEKYYYAETKTWHTTYKDGLEVLEFPNGQTERRHPDGSMEISFPNGCVRYCDSKGRDEWRFSDGTVIKTDENGHKVLLMPNGQKEIYTKEYKKREYPDGTVKILYPDGTQETRYSSGRVRLKNKDGVLLMDSGGIR